MYQTLINHPKLKVARSTGSEGPHHDPYAYEELSVSTPAGETVMHGGLGSWITHNGYRLDGTGTDGDEVVFDAFVKLTGYTPKQLERIHRKLNSRCRKCGCREIEWMSGYPGEHFEVCANCKNIVDSYFCESEIL